MRLVLALALLIATACGGPPAAQPAGDEGCREQRETGIFDRSCIFQATHTARLRASACRKTARGPAGEAHVKVFWSPKGAVTKALLDRENPFAGTEVERCVLRSFEEARMPPFSGEPFTLGLFIRVE